MSFVNDLRDAKHRFGKYIDQMSGLLQRYGITGKDWYKKLQRANENPEFIAKRNAIWKEILEQEGGKLTFGSVLAIIGAVLGGVGIAGAWGAFGLPLVLLLAPAGVWIGNELDSEGIARRWAKEIGSSN